MVCVLARVSEARQTRVLRVERGRRAATRVPAVLLSPNSVQRRNAMLLVLVIGVQLLRDPHRGRSVSFHLFGEVGGSPAALSGLMEDSIRESFGALLGEIILNDENFLNFLILFRTDSQGRHINGQGNFGFCSRSCDSSSSNVNNVDLGIFERRPGFDDDETAIVFTDNEDDAIVKMPPS